MAKISKRYKALQTQVTPGKPYSLDEALKIIQSNSKTKFVESVDVAVRLGVDAKKSDQQVRGTVSLPHGTGKKQVIWALTEAPDKAKTAGAERAGEVADAAEHDADGRGDAARRGRGCARNAALAQRAHCIRAGLLRLRGAVGAVAEDGARERAAEVLDARAGGKVRGHARERGEVAPHGLGLEHGAHVAEVHARAQHADHGLLGLLKHPRGRRRGARRLRRPRHRPHAVRSACNP